MGGRHYLGIRGRDHSVTGGAFIQELGGAFVRNLHRILSVIRIPHSSETHRNPNRRLNGAFHSSSYINRWRQE
jgi:hypothetical protein